jgi:hypothetical protein
MKKHTSDRAILCENFPLSKCKAVLEKDGSTYADEELKLIRSFLFMLADIEYHNHIKEKEHEALFKDNNLKENDNESTKENKNLYDEAA